MSDTVEASPPDAAPAPTPLETLQALRNEAAQQHDLVLNQERDLKEQLRITTQALDQTKGRIMAYDDMIQRMGGPTNGNPVAKAEPNRAQRRTAARPRKPRARKST